MKENVDLKFENSLGVRNAFPIQQIHKLKKKNKHMI
jgi:hypothetical protein